MFKVKYKIVTPECTEESITVYDIKRDNTGFPHFLIYNNDRKEWKYVSAKFFRPAEEGTNE